MKVLVAMKVVPLLDAVRFQAELNRLVRDGDDLIVNPPDEHALSLGLALAEEAADEVTVVTMGPPQIEQCAKRILETGVDRVIHLSDARFAGADTLATARALAQVWRLEMPDLLLCGRGAIDGGTAQTPPQVAEILGVPYLSGVLSATVGDRTLRVVREVERGTEQHLLALPAVLSVEPRMNRAVDRRRSSTAVLERWDAERLGGDDTGYGIRGSRTYVQRVGTLAFTRAAEPLGSADAVAMIERGYRAALAGIADVPSRSNARSSAPNALWAVAERDGTELHPVSFEAIACAAQVAERLEAEIVAVLPCDDPGVLPYELAARGADRVLVATAPDIVGNDVQVTAAVLSSLLADRRPLGVIAPWSSRGREYLPRVAARLELGLTGDFAGLDVAARPGNDKMMDIVWLKPAWAGSALARVVGRSVPSLGTLRPGAVRQLPVRSAVGTPVELVSFGPLASPGSDELLATEPLGSGLGSPVDTALVVFCVGSRVDPATVSRLQSLTAGHPWAVAGTAGAVAAGLVPGQMELSVIKRSIAPPVFVGVELDTADDLACVCSAGIVITTAKEPFAGGRYGVDAVVAEVPDAFIEVLARAMESWQEHRVNAP